MAGSELNAAPSQRGVHSRRRPTKLRCYPSHGQAGGVQLHRLLDLGFSECSSVGRYAGPLEQSTDTGPVEVVTDCQLDG